ncbi:uncharacterized protein LOC114446464 [Parambassis ranga]|uniref:Uncharacterized protein LOC114446464 n=1 Tax=Parambassis ranga TaxID=210632 RepID=A0A6P7JLS7_9TELE|nr:uncharacterized protein LOC114446464 [Parambassis ranga]
MLTGKPDPLKSTNIRYGETTLTEEEKHFKEMKTDMDSTTGCIDDIVNAFVCDWEETSQNISELKELVFSWNDKYGKDVALEMTQQYLQKCFAGQKMFCEYFKDLVEVNISETRVSKAKKVRKLKRTLKSCESSSPRSTPKEKGATEEDQWSQSSITLSSSLSRSHETEEEYTESEEAQKKGKKKVFRRVKGAFKKSFSKKLAPVSSHSDDHTPETRVSKAKKVRKLKRTLTSCKSSSPQSTPEEKGDTEVNACSQSSITLSSSSSWSHKTEKECTESEEAQKKGKKKVFRRVTGAFKKRFSTKVVPVTSDSDDHAPETRVSKAKKVRKLKRTLKSY